MSDKWQGPETEKVASLQDAAERFERADVIARLVDGLGCLNGPDGCEGEVLYRWPGYGERYWPRCEKHGEERVRREEEARERYPDSPCAPADFDPDYAGERWDEED